MKKYFLTGIATLLPLGIVLWIGSLFYKPMSILFGSYGLLPLVLAIVVGIGTVFGIGVLIQHSKLVVRSKEWIDNKIIARVPGVKTIYKMSKDLANSALEDKVYDQTVFVYPYGKYGAKEVGFLTNAETGTIFVPTAPNPLNGRLYFDCTPISTQDSESWDGCKYELTNWTYDQVIKWTVSVGVANAK